MTGNDEESLLESQGQREEDEVGSVPVENINELCLICCSKVEINPVLNDSTKLLDKCLVVIFILRNILKVPNRQLEKNLKEFGNPSEWIRLCDQCTNITRKAEKLYCQIVRNSRELRSIEKLIVKKIRILSSKSIDKEVNSKISRDKLEIRTRIRHHVKNYGYIEQAKEESYPFLEGDKLAKYLVNVTTNSPFETEFDTQLNDNDDVDNVSHHDDWDNDNNGIQDVGDGLQEVETDTKNVNATTTPTKPSRRTNRSSRKRLTSGLRRQYKKTIYINGKWKCRHCDKLFLSSSACSVHEQKNHYSNPSDKYICDICGKASRDPNSLLVHRRNVHKIRLDGTSTIRKPKKPEPPRKKYPSTCNICGKYFQDHISCKNHIRYVHESSMEFKCDICGVTAFARSFDLKRHKLTVHKDNPRIKELGEEEGVKIWRCEVKGCRAQFIKKRNLDKHSEMVHKGEFANGRFSCSFCGKGFWEMNNLKSHELVHRNVMEGINPFCCEECGLGFPSPGYLNNHKQRVHKKAKKN